MSLCTRSISLGLKLSSSSPFCFISRILPQTTPLSLLSSNAPSAMPNSSVKINSSEFRSLFTAELDLVSNLFQKYGYELRIAGGAVRDLLLGQLPHDVDFATTATPSQMIKLFEKESIRMLNKKGEKHGTVTCRINDKENFEITTLRIDKVCDGRHAEVEFTTDWLKDANRRDLTVNSLFLGLDGTVYDYFNGIEHLNERRILFVGDAEKRIQEDYLRILRYFRFFGRLAKTADNHDQDTLLAIKKNVKGLHGISGERLWTEFKKIVTGRFSGSVVKEMLNCGVGSYLGLPNVPNVEEFLRVTAKCFDYDPKPMTVISSLLYTNEDVLTLDRRLKLSNKERFIGTFITQHRSKESLDENAFKNLVVELQSPALKMENASDYVIELIKYSGNFNVLESFKAWTPPKFPIDGVMLMHWGVRKGPAMKIVLLKLFEFWKEKQYDVTNDEFLSKIDEVYKRDRSKSPVQAKQ